MMDNREQALTHSLRRHVDELAGKIGDEPAFRVGYEAQKIGWVALDAREDAAAQRPCLDVVVAFLLPTFSAQSVLPRLCDISG